MNNFGRIGVPIKKVEPTKYAQFPEKIEPKVELPQKEVCKNCGNDTFIVSEEKNYYLVYCSKCKTDLRTFEF
jgi:ribosomal protein S27AE